MKTIDNELKELITDIHDCVVSSKDIDHKKYIFAFYKAARELLTLKEQIAAGKIAIVPVPATDKMIEAHETVCWDTDYHRGTSVQAGLAYTAMLSASGAYNFEKGTFDE